MRMARTGLLVVTSLSKIAISLVAARKHVLGTLYVQLYSPFLQTHQTPTFSKAITAIYASSMRWCRDVDVRIIVGNLKPNNIKKFSKSIDVLLFDNCFPTEDAAKVSNSYSSASVVKLPADDVTTTSTSDDVPAPIVKFDFDDTGSQEDITVYDNVVLGGTFDRLHTGHKILLTEAIIRARKRLVVGVTDESIVKGKTLFELILPVQQRIENVIEFLNSVDNTLIYDVVPIYDPFGPTKTDPNLDLIVVSKETLGGGKKVNEIRALSGLSILKIHSIDLVEMEKDFEHKESKQSSSNQRMDLLGTRLREPELNHRIPLKPYIIGLIGGIASGKSVMSARLERLGGNVIDCDKLAHQLYEPNEPCYDSIVAEFGTEVLSIDGTVNRRRLGEIVFGDPTKLQKLNGIVWPSLMQLAKTKIRELPDPKVVFLEAAVLLQAGWETECHEIWSLIVPPAEAIRRLMERNQLTEEQAQLRIMAQPDNQTVVKHSNVVFSSQWNPEFTQQQAERAWRGLMKHLRELENCSKL